MRFRPKWWFYIRHTVRTAFTNKLRISLTFTGILIAVFIFAAGNILINSYYTTKFNELNVMDSYSILLSEREPERLKEIKSVLGKSGVKAAVIGEFMPIKYYQTSGGRYINTAVRINFLSSFDSLFATMTEGGFVIPYKAELIEGRMITGEEAAEGASVAVITEFAAKLLFPGSSAVGQTITTYGLINGTQEYQNDMKYLKLKIVGIVKNNYIDEKNVLDFRRELSENDDSVIGKACIFCPYLLLQTVDYDIRSEINIYSFANSDEYEKAIGKIEAYKNIAKLNGRSVFYSTKDILIKNLKTELVPVKTFFNNLILILCVITGFSIFVIVFFSMKEKVREIGIRKAYGAGGADIFALCASELLISAFIGSVVAVVLACSLSGYLSEAARDRLFVIIDIHITAREVVLPVIIGFIQVIAAGLIPCVYAALIRPVKALKFE